MMGTKILPGPFVVSQDQEMMVEGCPAALLRRSGHITGLCARTFQNTLCLALAIRNRHLARDPVTLKPHRQFS